MKLHFIGSGIDAYPRCHVLTQTYNTEILGALEAYASVLGKTRTKLAPTALLFGV